MRDFSIRRAYLYPGKNQEQYVQRINLSYLNMLVIYSLKARFIIISKLFF